MKNKIKIRFDIIEPMKIVPWCDSTVANLTSCNRLKVGSLTLNRALPSAKSKCY